MFRFTKIATAVALAAATTLTMAADPIKIGVDGPFTGGSSSMGVSMRDGVRLATEEINKAGGVLGRQIVLIERDDEAKNERGVQIAEELINKEKVVAAVGYINTGVSLASQRFFQEAKIPVMNNVATGSIVTVARAGRVHVVAPRRGRSPRAAHAGSGGARTYPRIPRGGLSSLWALGAARSTGAMLHRAHRVSRVRRCGGALERASS